MKKILFIILFFGYSFIQSLACSCDSTSIKDAYDSCDNIFLGFIVKAEFYSYIDTLFADEAIEEVAFKYTIRVQEMYKGDSLLEIIVLTDCGSSCHYPLKHGQSYLIYSYSWRGFQRTNMCTRTKSLSDSLVWDELSILNRLKINNNQGVYLDGVYKNEKMNTSFSFFPSGKFKYWSDIDSSTYGEGEYCFQNDSLILDFNNAVENYSRVRCNFGNDTIENFVFELNVIDFNTNKKIDDYSVCYLDPRNKKLIPNKDEESNIIKFPVGQKVKKLVFSHPEYPDLNYEPGDWYELYRHKLNVIWQKNFEPLSNKRIIYKVNKLGTDAFVLKYTDELFSKVER